MKISPVGIVGSLTLAATLATSTASAQSAPPGPQPPPGYAVQPAPGQPPPGYAQAPMPPPGYAPGYGPPPGYPVPPGAYPPPQPIEKERRSTGMMVAGIVLTGVGAISLIAGALTYSLAAVNTTNDALSCSLNTTVSNCAKDHSGQQAAGAVMMVAGVAGIGVGIPLWIIGGRKVPVDRNQPRDEAKLFLSPARVSLQVPF